MGDVGCEFFVSCRADYIQLVYSALPRFSGYFKTLPPCIWKPTMLWSGKQVVSTVLLNIIPEDQDKLNLISKAKIAQKVPITTRLNTSSEINSFTSSCSLHVLAFIISIPLGVLLLVQF